MSYRNHLYSRELRVDLQGNGDFTSIKAACDHAATISPRNASNYVLIHVNAGDYTENDFTVPTYTALVGAGQGGEVTLPSTFIGPSNTSASGTRSAFVTLDQYATISDLVISFWTGTASGLLQDFGTVKTLDDAWIENCRINFSPTYSGANTVSAILGVGGASDTLNILRSTMSVGGGSSSICVKSSQRVGCSYSRLTGSAATSLYITSSSVSTISFSRLESQVTDIHADTGTVNIISTKAALNMRTGTATFVDMHPTPQQTETSIRAATNSVSASYTIDAYDDGTVDSDLGGSVITMPPVADCIPGQGFVVENKSLGTVTVDANDTIFANGSSLNDGLISHWAMDEVSGVRYDSFGQNDLTDNNTVGSRTGLLNNAADFIATNSEYLSIADNADMSHDGTDFAWSMWVYVDAWRQNNWLISKFDASNFKELSVVIEGTAGTSGTILYTLYDNGTTGTTITAATIVGTGSWFHLYLEWDDSAKQMGISVDNEALTTLAAPGLTVKAGSVPLQLATYGVIPGNINQTHDGAMDEVSFWKRTLTTDERTEVFNLGAPKHFLRPTTLTNKLIAYWPMNEPSGVRADIIGGNDLTDNNTVGTRAGLLNPAADFIAANTEYLSIADNPDISAGGTDFAWSIWAKVDVLPAGGNGAYLVCKRADPANAEFQVDIPTATGLPRIIVFKNGTTSTNMSAISTVDVSGGDWFHVYVEYDSVTGTVGISVNGETMVTTTDGTWAIANTTSDLLFGGYPDPPIASNRFDGAISDVAFWKRKLTVAERTEIYNSGVPLYNMVTSETQMVLPAKGDSVTLQLIDGEWALMSDNRHTAKASFNDLYPGYLSDKLAGEAGKITLTEVGDGANEQLTIDIGGDVFDKTVDDAVDVSYTPSNPIDWDDPDPTEVRTALDDLATRLQTVSTSVGQSWAVTTPAGTTGTFYAGGFYRMATLPNTFSPGINFGTVNSSYAAHFFVVLGANPVDTVTITVTGTSINDSGTRTVGDTQNIVFGVGDATNDYFETSKKWIGQITVGTTGGTPISCNYGFSKYWDNNNRDFTVTGLEATWRGGATDSSADLKLLHHKTTGWTYNAGAPATPPPPIAAMKTDHVTESSVINNEPGAWKRVGLNTAINGSGEEGVIIQIITGQAKAFELGNFSLTLDL